MGPAVNSMGWRLSLSNNRPRSRVAQTFVRPSRLAWKTKYLPSGVQLPQHSAGGLLHPSNRRCRLLPPAETSGDHRGQLATPGSSTSFRDSVPSALATYRARSWEYTIDSPPGDHAASTAVKPSRRRGETPTTGIAQSEYSGPGPGLLPIRSSKAFDDIPKRAGCGREAGIGSVSPLLRDTWARKRPPGAVSTK